VEAVGHKMKALFDPLERVSFGVSDETSDALLEAFFLEGSHSPEISHSTQGTSGPTQRAV
jgi:hypothetical protein